MKFIKVCLRNLRTFFSRRNLNKLSIKRRSYPKSTKINAFEQKLNIYHKMKNNLIIIFFSNKYPDTNYRLHVKINIKFEKKN